MPIVVDEVVIAVDVGSSPPDGAGPGTAGAASASPSQDTQALVAECVERVLEILAQNRER